MPKMPEQDQKQQQIMQERIMEVEAELVIEEMINYEKVVAQETELNIAGNKINVKHFKDFIIERLRSDFKEELQEHLNYLIATQSDVPLVRQNALKPTDGLRIQNQVHQIKHSWQAPQWQRVVLEDYVNRPSRVAKP